MLLELTPALAALLPLLNIAGRWGFLKKPNPLLRVPCPSLAAISAMAACAFSAANLASRYVSSDGSLDAGGGSS